MFATFDSSMSAGSNQQDASTARRARRSQVARACNWCRLNRIKCDDRLPCKNCKDRGNPCSNDRTDKILSKTLPQANKEIIALRAKVSELETQLKEKATLTNPAPEAEKSSSPQGPSSAIPGTSSVASQNEHANVSWDAMDDAPDSWLRMQGSTASTTNGVAGGTDVSALYSDSACARRAQAYLAEMLQLSTPLDSFVRPAASTEVGALDTDEILTRVQENHLLDLFWQSYHCFIPILNVREVQEYHNMLWSSPTFSDYGSSERSQSALLDIILALCIQYGSTLLSEKSSCSRLQQEDPNSGGVWLYHRCQSAMAGRHENHSMLMLRCRIFSTLYLLNAGQFAAAYQALGAAARTARVLGLHREPNENVGRPRRHLLRRIWWNLVVLDTRICLEMNQPYLVDLSDATITLPTDDLEEAELSSAGLFSNIADLSHLSCNTWCVRLALLTRSTHASLQSRCSEAANILSPNLIHPDPSSSESCASFLLSRMELFHEWARSVPEALKHPRRGTASSFSTSKAPLKLDVYAPLWLQRQRVYLELLYHSVMASIYRTFIRFSLSASSGTKDHTTPISNGHGVLSLNHAATTTNIIHQLLTETELINSWTAMYHLQWNASITLLTFAVAHPVCTFTSLAREAIKTAISNFDYFSRYSVPSAPSASRFTRLIDSRLDLLVQRFRGGGVSNSSSQTPSSRHSISSPDLGGSLVNMSLYSQNSATPSLVYSDGPGDAFSGRWSPRQIYGSRDVAGHDPHSAAAALSGTLLSPKDAFELHSAADCFAFSAADFDVAPTQLALSGLKDTGFGGVQMELSDSSLGLHLDKPGRRQSSRGGSRGGGQIWENMHMGTGRHFKGSEAQFDSLMV